MSGISSIGMDPGTSILSTKEASYGDNPFLSLLVTQLRSQTPLEPVDNSSFMQQMAMYSSMEEQKALNDNMLKLLNFQGVLARLQGLSEGSSLLGKITSYALEDGSEGKGIVKAVFVNEEGEVRLRVGEEGKEIGMNQVTGIEEPEESE